MRFNKLLLCNYRQYVDVEFDFDEKINIIEGENGIGKSTFMSSIIFALYGIREVEKSKLLDKIEYLANQDTVSGKPGDYDFSKPETKVVLTIEMDELEGKKYQIERTFNNRRFHTDYMTGEIGVYNTVNFEKVVAYEVGTASKREVEMDIITDSLPENIVPLLFFDGERIKSVESVINSTMTGKDNFKSEIERILRISNLENAKTLITQACKNLENVIAKSSHDGQISELTTKKHSIERNIESNKTKLEEFENKIDVIEVEREEIKQYLKQHDQSKLLEEKRESLNAQITDKKDEKKNKEIDLLSALWERGPAMARSLQYTSLVDKISKRSTLYEVRGMEQQAIEDIMENGVCICGTKIDDKMKIQLNELHSTLPPESFESMLRGEATDASDIKELLDRNKDLRKRYMKDARSIKDLEKEVENISEELSNIDSSEVKLKESRNRDLKDQLDELVKNKYMLEGVTEKFESGLEKTNSELDSLTRKKNSNNDDYQAKLDLEDSKVFVENKINERRETIRTNLEKYINQNADKLLRDKVEIKLDKFLKPSVKFAAGSESASSGQNVMISLSYLLGLMQIAKDDTNTLESDGINMKYPMVMDGVTAVLDVNHIQNMIQNVLAVDSQVIFLVNDQTIVKLSEAVQKVLEIDNIDNQYIKIKRDVNTNIAYIEGK